MKIKKYSDIFEDGLKIFKGNENKKHVEYISDVFLRLEDTGKYHISIETYGNNFFDIYISTKEIREYGEHTHGEKIGGVKPMNGFFNSLEDYFEFNDIMKRILNHLSHDYNIDYYDYYRDNDEHNYFVMINYKELK
jgi:hypothetical protein